MKSLPELFLAWEDVAKALQNSKQKYPNPIKLDDDKLNRTELDIQYTDSVERDVSSWQK